MFKMLAQTILLILVSGSFPAAMAEMSGVYLQSSPQQLQVLHLVESKSGSLSGQLETYHLKISGHLSSATLHLTGNVSDRQIILKTSSDLSTLFTTISLAGKLSGRTLHLTWQDGAGRFQKSSLSNRNKKLQELTDLSEAIKIRNEETRRLEQFQKTQDELKLLLNSVEPVSSQMSALRSSYITTREAARKQQAELALTVNKLGHMSDEAYALEDELFELTDELRSVADTVHTVRSDLNWRLSSAQQDIDRLLRYCHENAQHPSQRLSDLCDLGSEGNDFLQEFREVMRPEFKSWDSLQAGN
tara:strand:+ start:14626 stop:15531 length:906 start_codon:yes stop_codon:yes gene_type:complete